MDSQFDFCLYLQSSPSPSDNMKRGRDQTPEEEPLAKRINNLHLGGSTQLINGTNLALVPPGGFPPTSAPGGHPLTSPTGQPLAPPTGHLLPPTVNSPQGHLNNIPVANGLINNNVPNGIVNNGISGLSSGVVGPGGAEVNLEAMAREMIVRRELPESLSLSYPNLNPTENDQYFSFNRTLHHLHIERLRRMGKLPL
ncbi:hypothetical protein Pcinc_018885 [Petrolisthes cinctipes]|uniref:Uncharacterized protein n=1 Tax=Petrolisthes cinctipes TaxID=88211 RepID=A0AAE1FM05_PETCI|nr:hypothetical protein Pcinc_018885 [Petrolisthes cinctipes]